MKNPLTVVVFAAVPAILAVGALYWLTFGERVGADVHSAAQADRGAVIVHATPRPASPVRVVVEHDKYTDILEVSYEPGKLSGYVKNTGHTCRDFLEVSWSVRAPDGTILASGYNFATAGSVQSGERVEWSTDQLPTDDRIATVKLKSTSSGYCNQD